MHLKLCKVKKTTLIEINKVIDFDTMIRKILMNQSYVGDVVNFKTYSKSFKLKDRIDNERENWQFHENVHELRTFRGDSKTFWEHQM